MRGAFAAEAVGQALSLLDAGAGVAFLAQGQKPEAAEECPIRCAVVAAGFDIGLEQTVSGGQAVLVAVEHGGRPEQPFQIVRAQRCQIVRCTQQLKRIRPVPLLIGVTGPFQQQGGLGFHRQSIALPNNWQKNGRCQASSSRRERPG
ncbi:hypothetical protein [Mesorhizobium sp.]|uniref:hypothetical protein n=1 Tax=Mesorhizobium sp. TaxID=1871066 RepID=UPI0025BCF6C9|nr:hypothetical protein [Mesorhizobium sp.]